MQQCHARHTGCDYDECCAIVVAVALRLRSAGLYAIQGAVHQHVHNFCYIRMSLTWTDTAAQMVPHFGVTPMPTPSMNVAAGIDGYN